jgi:transcriptional regulator of heat shock response
MSTHFNHNEVVLQALQEYQVSYSKIIFSDDENGVTITLGKETDLSNLKHFTLYLSALNLNFKSSFQSKTGLINITVY